MKLTCYLEKKEKIKCWLTWALRDSFYVSNEETVCFSICFEGKKVERSNIM